MEVQPISTPEIRDAEIPSLVESAVVLGVLVVGAASCWLLYGRLIQMMFRIITEWLAG